MRSLIRRFRTDTAGNIAVLSALCLPVLLGFVALGVDIGSVFADRRRLQSAADLAAITAATNLAKASAGASATLQMNKFAPSALVGVETGIYTATPAIDIAKRFTPSGVSSANAARVTLKSQTPLFFGKFVTGKDAYTISTNATATTTAIASFAIGSRLVSLNGGLLNSILGSMLGTSLSLSAMDYQALIDARIDALDFMSALATRLNVTAGTYGSLLNANAGVSDILQAMLATQKNANGNTSATLALSAVAQSAAGITTKIAASALLDPGPYSGLQIGDKPRTGSLLSVYDLLNATAQTTNGSQQIATNVNLNLPGIAAVSLRVAIGERPVGKSWITVGTQGASVHTAQTRVLLDVQLVGTGAVSVVNLPVYVEIASGSATLNDVKCGFPDINTSSVTLGVKPGVVDAWIGAVTQAQMSNFTSPPNPPAATLVNLGLVQVAGRAHAQIANPSAKTVSFSYADIRAQNKKTVTTQSFTTSLIGSLLGDLQLNVVVIGLGIPIPGLGALVTGVISAATTSIDSLLVSVLGTLGVGVGQADVWTTGIRCDGAVLVN